MSFRILMRSLLSRLMKVGKAKGIDDETSGAEYEKAETTRIVNI